MARSKGKQWNPKYLAKCVQHALELLGAAGVVGDLLLEASAHIECTEPIECRSYRQTLRRRSNRVRRSRPVQTWEYWLLKATEQILQPVPGVKHSAVTMLRSAIEEYNPELRPAWHEWYQQHAVQEPAYL
jgi:hypothetical protein